MDVEIRTQVKRVQKLSKFLRVSCTFLMVMLALVTVAVFVAVVLSDRSTAVGVGAFRVPPNQVTVPMQLYYLLMAAFLLLVIFSGLFHLRALLVNLSAGGIYTHENARHLRHLGSLGLLVATWQFVQPVLEAALITMGVFDKSMAIPGAAVLGLLEGRLNLEAVLEALPPFILAGLVILAAWIMDIGRHTSEEAEQMRREAELVV